MIILSPLVIFKLFLLISVMLALSRGSRLMMWLALEMNILRFLPILVSGEISPLENSMKYFLIQRVASILFIMAVLVMSFNYARFIEAGIVLALLIKLGAAPFHG